MSLKQDFISTKNNKKGLLFLFLFRLSHFFAVGNLFFRMIGFPYRVFYLLFVQWFLGIDIPDKTTIEEGLNVWHGQALIIHPDCIIGKNVTLRHSTTIGQKHNNERPPVIGDNVDIGAHCIIIGDIHIGNNSIIGAGTFVNRNIPADSIVYGNPLVIKMRKEF
jgi:serine acetyltransferase